MKFNQTVQLALVTCLGLLGAYFFVTFMWKILMWSFVILAILMLIMNRKLAIQMYEWLRKLYVKNTALGVVATLMIILISPLVILFLAGKTVFEFSQSKTGKKLFGQKTEEETTYTEISSELKDGNKAP